MTQLARNPLSTFSPFNLNGPSQIKPFKPASYKRPNITQPTANIHASIASPDEGKKMRMSKTSI